jgi:hypothetical protein
MWKFDLATVRIVGAPGLVFETWETTYHAVTKLEHFHSRCNPGTEALATFLAGKVALKSSETTWITVTVKML